MTNEPQTKDDVGPALDAAVRTELSEGERVLWVGRPDADAMVLPLLPFPILWLTGLFLLCVAALEHTSISDTGRVIVGMVFLLVVVALMGIIEVIAVPTQSKRGAYVITNSRTFILKLRGRLGYTGMTNYSFVTRRLVRPEKATLMFHFLYSVPTYFIFIYLFVHVLPSFVDQMDVYVVAGFLMILSGWLYQWHSDMRYPFLPQLRECPRAFYVINEWLASVESVPHSVVVKTILRNSPSKCGDIFLLAKGKGCMRIKSVPNAKEVYGILEEQLKKT